MTNEFFRNRLISQIDAAVAAFQQASQLAHPFLTGRVREIAIRQLIAPLLSAEFNIGTGKVADHVGNLSAETDLIIYSSKTIPPILFSDQLGVFPLDSCFAAIEIKSRLTGAELKEAVENSRSLRELKHVSGHFDRVGKGTLHEVEAIICSLFAFASDLSARDEFERYKEKDRCWNDSPALDLFCIVGKGTWFWLPGTATWNFVTPTQYHEEVIFFLTSIVSGLNDKMQTRGHPRIGSYLSPDKYTQL